VGQSLLHPEVAVCPARGAGCSGAPLGLQTVNISLLI